ncbi:hypothetical protein PVAND_015036 [Polypedilum vanderplanki]|uniref:Uncharacterized protein n=1 Tax=Polypedilum vanderplanki TaxID=319348 RepID=A0A9J6BBV9_POLVA|nr:hypothetical protein PVAND_015036 [Polypedilum vanderplanki]
MSDCSFGYTFDENCQCVCTLADADCPNGYFANPNDCSCTETSSSSIEPSSKNSNSNEELSSEKTNSLFSSCSISECKCGYIDYSKCECIQPIVDCLPGYFYNQDTCECYCSLNVADCPSGTFINLTDCSCNNISSSVEESSSSSFSCLIPPKCGKPCDKIDYERCECIELIVDCFGGFILTEDGCDCFCSLNQSTCPDNTNFNPTSCICQSQSSSKESSSTSEESSFSVCHQQNCLENEEWSQEYCSCVCRKNVECQPGFIFDSLFVNVFLNMNQVVQKNLSIIQLYANAFVLK